MSEALRTFGTRIGKAAADGCPFCRSLFHAPPQVGEDIFFLSGLHTGMCATVIPARMAARDDEFWSKVWTDDRGSSYICHPDQDRALPRDAYDVPAWMPPLSMTDSFHLHESLRGCLEASILSAEPDAVFQAMTSVVSCCWFGRLPVTGDEVWSILAGHGVEAHWRQRVLSAFTFGMRLLTQAKGRKPNQRRRMAPMSRIQYMTPHMEPLWQAQKRHDNTPDLWVDDAGNLHSRL